MTLLPLITRAVDWLHRHVDDVVGAGALIDYDHPTPPTQTPLLEIPLLCRALQDPAVAAQLSAVTRQQRDNLIIRVAASDRDEDDHLSADPSSYPYQLVRKGLLAGCGIRVDNPDTHRALIRLGYGGITSQTRPPSAILELRWAQRLLGAHVVDGDSDADLYRRDMLAHNLDLARTTDYEAYIATHLIFYLTDLGRSPWPAELDGDRGQAAAWMSQLLALHLCRSHWDLVAELLLCWRALGLADTPLTGYGWEQLHASQGPTGLVPGPWWRDTASAPETSYHTTLVAALAAAMWLRSAETPREVALPDVPRPAVVDDSWWTAVSALVPDRHQCLSGPVSGVHAGPQVLRASRDAVLTMCDNTTRQQPSPTGPPLFDQAPVRGSGGEYLAVRGIHALREGDLVLADTCLAAALASTGLTTLTRSGAEDLLCRISLDQTSLEPTRTLQALARLRPAARPALKNRVDATVAPRGCQDVTLPAH